MGIYSWDSFGPDSIDPQHSIGTPRLTIGCEYPDTGMAPTEVCFRLSRRYGIHTANEAHEWFLSMMHAHEEFVVETDRVGEPPMPF